MTLRNTDERWSWPSQWLHWSVVVLVVGLATAGLLMTEMPNTPRKIEIYALHKSFGLTVLVLAAIRLAWRLYAGTPAPVPGSPRWQERIASLTHALLYAVLFAMPLTGWLFNSAAGYPLQFFGLFNLPALAGSDEALREAALSLHKAGFWVLLSLVVLHAGAAFYHHLFLGDATLRRMLPGRRPPQA
ncbi:cytochrome b [Lysobacter sp. A3-1-A15]|uniref:cytochrome b n=1 Tax=Novilysobacter viscosus TaxID=3098602 RepID=UPI002EDA8B2F